MNVNLQMQSYQLYVDIAASGCWLEQQLSAGKYGMCKLKWNYSLVVKMLH